MTFLAPSRLWLLLAIAALAIAYVILQSRRRHYAARFTNLDLLASVAPRHPGWRRHVAAAAIGLGLVALIVGIARPVRDEKVPSDEAVVMLVVDVSASMEATDVAPSRLQAAQEAAARFVKGVPDKFQVGLISFDESTHVLATPARRARRRSAGRAARRAAPAFATATTTPRSSSGRRRSRSRTGSRWRSTHGHPVCSWRRSTRRG